MSKTGDLRRFYELLDVLEGNIGGRRKLATLERPSMPKRGVYFFFEPGETRSGSGNASRIVRVGTHALVAGSGSTLLGRLHQHRGGKTGGGNHRGSIFRLLVGQALIARGDVGTCPSWGIAGDLTKAANKLGIPRTRLAAAEAPVERAVSLRIGAMDVLWLSVADEPGPESVRGHIEAGAISLLSNYQGDPIDPPSATWLGHDSNRPLVVGSALWNQRHVKEQATPGFLDLFADTIAANASAKR